MNCDWEFINGDNYNWIERLAVPTGWIYRCMRCETNNGLLHCDSMVFVPANVEIEQALYDRKDLNV